ISLSFAPVFFSFSDPPTTEIYTLSLHDALPICRGSDARRQHAPAATLPAGERQSFGRRAAAIRARAVRRRSSSYRPAAAVELSRSEEHTSELQSRGHLVCRLLLEKKKKQKELTQ